MTRGPRSSSTLASGISSGIPARVPNGSPGSVSRGLAVGACLLVLLLSSCERTPSKSDYVSARVSEMCAEQEGREALQACRLAVINQFKDVPFEEMKRRYPEPEPRPRPSCTL